MASYLPRLVSFFLLPVYAVYLPPEAMGIVEMCLVIQVLMEASSRLGLPGAFARYYFDNREPEAFRDLLTTTTLAVLISSSAFALIGLLAGPYIFARFLPEVAFHPYFDLAIFVGFLQFGPELQARVLQVSEESKLAASINVVVSLFGTAVKLLFVVGFEWGALGAVYAEVATSAFAMSIAVSRHWRDISGHFRLDMLRSLLSYGLPLVPHRVGAWAATFAGQWIMGMYGVLGAVGQLSVAAKLVSPLRIITGAFATAFGPVYFAWRSDEVPEVALAHTRRTAGAVLTLVGVGALGVSLFGAIVVFYLMPETYRPAAGAVGVLAASVEVRLIYNVLGQELLYAKRTKVTALIAPSGAVIAVIATVLLVPPYGVLGAAWAQVLSVATIVFVTALLARQTFPTAVALRTWLATLIATFGAAFAWQAISGEGVVMDVVVATGVFSVLSVVVLAAAGVGPAQLRGALAIVRRRKKKSAG